MTRIFTQEEAAQFLFLINYGYDDYLGARTLLNSGVYLPALILAHTAIEKQIKLTSPKKSEAVKSRVFRSCKVVTYM